MILAAICRSFGPPRRLAARVTAVAVLFTLASLQVAAAIQDESGPSATVPQTTELRPAPIPSTSPLSDGGARIVLQTEDGKLIPLRDLGFPISLLKDLTERAELQTQVPAAEVTQVEITGEIRDDKFRFDAHLRIRVAVDDEWVSLPVGFDEAQLIRKTHHGETEQHAVIYDSSSAAKPRWFLKGRGTHDLQLSMIHQFRRGPQGRDRIRLTVPPSPTSHLVVTLNQPVTPQQPTTGAAIASEIEGDTTNIEMWGFSPSLDLEWQPILATADATSSLRSTERIRLDLATQPVSMSVTQSVRVRDGAYEQLFVTLPSGMKLERVSARGDAGEVPVRSESIPTSEDSPVRVVLAFPERLSGDTDITWELGAIDDALPETLDVRLLQIDQATDQTGDVQILVPGGINLIPQETSNGVRRRRGSRATDSGGATTAYQLLGVESRLLLRTEEVPAFFTVEPHILLKPAETQMTMICRFVVRVERGSVQELVVDWPAELHEHWRPVAASSTDSVQPVIIHSVDSNELKLRFPSRQSDDFTVELQAIRDQPQRQENYEVRLPDIRTAGRHAVVLMLGDSDEVGVDVTTENDDLIPTTIDSENTFAEDAEKQVSIRNAWILPDSRIPLSLRFTEQNPRIRRTAFATVIPQENSLLYRQEIEYFVEHRDLEEFRLAVPEAIIPTVTLKASGEVLTPASGGSRGWTYRLPPESRRGRFTVAVEYAVPIPSDKDGSPPTSAPGVLQFPIIASDQEEFERVEVGVRDGSQIELLNDNGWVPLHSKDHPSMFLLPQDASGFSARWLPATSTRGAGIKLRAQIGFADSNGTRAAIRLAWIADAPPGTATISLPEGCELVGILVNGTETLPEFSGMKSNQTSNSDQPPAQQVAFRLGRTASDTAPSRHLIQLDVFQNFRSTGVPLRTDSIPLPTLHTESKSCRSIWYLRSRSSTAIIRPPQALTDRNRFAPGFPLMRRQLTAEIADPQSWLRTALPGSGVDVTELSPWTATQSASAAGFEGYASVERLTISSVTNGFALLIGASLSFLLAIVLIRYRPVPIALIVCVIGIAASVTEIAQPRLLFQLLPTLLGGMLLATLALIIDRRLAPGDLSRPRTAPSSKPVLLQPTMLAPTMLQDSSSELSHTADEPITKNASSGVG